MSYGKRNYPRRKQMIDPLRIKSAVVELEMAEQVVIMKAALVKISDPENLGSCQDFCECEHDSEDCCVNVGYHCPQCIAAVALKAIGAL